jgi:hypothetical protein
MAVEQDAVERSELHGRVRVQGKWTFKLMSLYMTWLRNRRDEGSVSDTMEY